MLLSLPLNSCSYSFTTLSLTGDKRIAEGDSQQLEIQDSLLDHYAQRTELVDINLLQFALQCNSYCIYKSQLKKQSSSVIVRTFPNYSPSPEGENYHLHYKLQLIKSVIEPVVADIHRHTKPLYVKDESGHVQWNLRIKDTLGPAIFVLYREVVLFQRSKNVLVLWESEPGEVSFIGRFFLLCPLYGGSFIGGSTVQLHYNYTDTNLGIQM